MEKPNEGEGQRERRFSQEQYDMLKRCSDKKDMTEWNQWRKQHPEEDICLDGADFAQCCLRGANFMRGKVCEENERTIEYTGEIHLDRANLDWAHVEDGHFSGASMRNAILWTAYAERANFGQTDLRGAELGSAHFDKCGFSDADLSEAILTASWLNGANLTHADLTRCQGRAASVDGETQFWKCHVDRRTDFREVNLDGCRIDPATKQLLQYNTRRKNWKEWYNEHPILRWPVWLFWLASDYGLSTWRVITSFGLLAFVFAVIYCLWPQCVMVYGDVGDIHSFVHALYFSVVTMTTLGFGDIAANPDSTCGQLLLMLQVILGYVLLGALVTRFAVLFTAGGPAGKFADDKGIIEQIREFMTKRFRRMKTQ